MAAPELQAARGGYDALVLLLVGGGLALGLPHVTARDRRRFWHPWVNAGLLPLLAGLAIGPTGAGWLSPGAAVALHPLLAVALAAAGVILGTQLRPAYLRAAGSEFLRRQTGVALGHFFVVALLLGGLWWAVAPVGSGIVAWAGWAGALALVTSQRPPGNADLARRDLVFGHLVSVGWWNLLGLVLGTFALSTTSAGWSILLLPPLAVGLGLLLGRSAAAAPSRADAFLFLPAVLSLAAGLALALGTQPLLTGLLAGAVFVSSGAGRAVQVERALDDLEQPVAVAVGLLAGLTLIGAEPLGWTWGILLVAPVRWLLRRRSGPTLPSVAGARERRLAPTGAAGVLLVGCAAVSGGTAPVLPAVVLIAVATLIADGFEPRRPA